ncbi:MAG TPA: hypothetical protein DD473_19110 [Planctomycetaceae bacterium]|nr:hypothetical protein [Planctomycetaceae bacterium]
MLADRFRQIALNLSEMNCYWVEYSPQLERERLPLQASVQFKVRSGIKNGSLSTLFLRNHDVNCPQRSPPRTQIISLLNLSRFPSISGENWRIES